MECRIVLVWVPGSRNERLRPAVVDVMSRLWRYSEDPASQERWRRRVLKQAAQYDALMNKVGKALERTRLALRYCGKNASD